MATHKKNDDNPHLLNINKDINTKGSELLSVIHLSVCTVVHSIDRLSTSVKETRLGVHFQ